MLQVHTRSFSRARPLLMPPAKKAIGVGRQNVDDAPELWNTILIWMITNGNKRDVSHKSCTATTTRVSSRRPPAVNGYDRGSNGGATEFGKGRL